MLPLKTLKGIGTVLVIDDDAMVLKTSTQLLKALGYTVHSAVSGEDALDRYADKLCGMDLAIIDMVMPGMDGGECHARIRVINPDIKTILCSGYGMDRSIQAVMAKGCDAFLPKPFSLRQVAALMQYLMTEPAEPFRKQATVLSRPSPPPRFSIPNIYYLENF
jgi:two-component system, cell cycle sensor histidine kinase and response regulator CckA